MVLMLKSNSITKLMKHFGWERVQKESLFRIRGFLKLKIRPRLFGGLGIGATTTPIILTGHSPSGLAFRYSAERCSSKEAYGSTNTGSVAFPVHVYKIQFGLSLAEIEIPSRIMHEANCGDGCG